MKTKYWNKKRVRPILTGPKEKITHLAVGLAESGMYSLQGIADICSDEAGRTITPGQVHYAMSVYGIRLNEVRNSVDTRDKGRLKMRRLVLELTADSVADKTHKVKYIRTRSK
jgi:F420-0:gamma-glutamyl ligase